MLANSLLNLNTFTLKHLVLASTKICSEPDRLLVLLGVPLLTARDFLFIVVRIVCFCCFNLRMKYTNASWARTPPAPIQRYIATKAWSWALLTHLCNCNSIVTMLKGKIDPKHQNKCPAIQNPDWDMNFTATAYEIICISVQMDSPKQLENSSFEG